MKHFIYLKRQVISYIFYLFLLFQSGFGPTQVSPKAVQIKNMKTSIIFNIAHFQDRVIQKKATLKQKSNPKSLQKKHLHVNEL